MIDYMSLLQKSAFITGEGAGATKTPNDCGTAAPGCDGFGNFCKRLESLIPIVLALDLVLE